MNCRRNFRWPDFKSASDWKLHSSIPSMSHRFWNTEWGSSRCWSISLKSRNAIRPQWPKAVKPRVSFLSAVVGFWSFRVDQVRYNSARPSMGSIGVKSACSCKTVPSVHALGNQPAFGILDANNRWNFPVALWLGKMTRQFSSWGCFKTDSTTRSKKEE